MSGTKRPSTNCRGGEESIVLGCPEIEVLISDKDLKLPVYPSTRINERAALIALQLVVDTRNATSGHTEPEHYSLLRSRLALT